MVYSADMSMHRFWTICEAASRGTLVVAVIIALGLSGGTAAERMYVQTSKAQAAALAEQNTLLPQPSESADQGSMARGSGPYSEQAALQAPVGVHPDNDTRYRVVQSSSLQTLAMAVMYDESYCLLQSSALVSSRLAEQFTLVGAKPSGTM